MTYSSGRRPLLPQERLSEERLEDQADLFEKAKLAFSYLDQVGIWVHDRTMVVDLEVGVGGGPLGVSAVANQPDELSRLNEPSNLDAVCHELAWPDRTVVGARRVVVEVHVPRLPFTLMRDDDPVARSTAAVDACHYPRGNRNDRLQFDPQQVVALVKVPSTGLAEVVAEPHVDSRLGEVLYDDLIVSGGRGGGQRHQDERDRYKCSLHWGSYSVRKPSC